MTLDPSLENLNIYTDVAVLKNSMTKVESALTEIKSSIGTLAKDLNAFTISASQNWQTKNESAQELINLKKEIIKELAETSAKVNEVKQIALTRSWLMSGAGLLLGAIATGLITYFFIHN